MGPFSRDYGIWLDGWKNKIKNSSNLFATMYAWVLAIMTLSNSVCSCTTPSITKIIIVCTILTSTLYHTLPQVTMRVESFAACLGNTISKIFGMSTELWQFCPKAATIELWISLSCSVWNVFLAYVATKTNTCWIIHCLFSSDWGCHSCDVWNLGRSMAVLSEGCCSWVMNLIITHLTDTIPLCVCAIV